MATLYENQVVWTYGSYNSTLQLSLYYTKSRSGTTQNYTFSGTMKAVPPSGGSTHFGYNIKVYINVNGDIHTVYDKTISSANWSSDLDNDLSFSVANKTSGTTPFIVNVVSSSVGLDWSGSANLPIDPYVVAPTYSSIGSSNISSSGATLTASINNGGATITGGGWQLSTNGGTNWTTYSGDWASKAITGLTRATTYTYRGYATNSVGTTYSSTSTFTTLAEKPSYTAKSANNIDSHSVRLTATIDNGGATITAGGWQLSTDGGSTWTTYSGDWTSKSITNLQRNTTYTYRGYATNSAGTTYSSTSTFTTLLDYPTVSAPTVSNITSNSLTASFTVTDNGGGTITSTYINIYDRDMDELVDTIQGTSGTTTALSPNTVYIVESHAVNARGQGMDYVQVTTPATASNIKVSINGAAFVSGTVKLSQNGGAFVTIPGSKVKTSINGGSF